MCSLGSNEECHGREENDQLGAEKRFPCAPEARVGKDGAQRREGHLAHQQGVRCWLARLGTPVGEDDS